MSTFHDLEAPTYTEFQPSVVYRQTAGASGTYQATGTNIGKIHELSCAVDILLQAGTGTSVTLNNTHFLKAGQLYRFRPAVGRESLGFQTISGIFSSSNMLTIAARDIGTTEIITAAPFSPVSIADCILWIRGDMGITTSGTSVLAWANQAAAGTFSPPATANRPTYSASDSTFNNQASVTFDGTDDYMQFSDVLTGSAFHFFCVKRHTALASLPDSGTGIWTFKSTAAADCFIPYKTGTSYDSTCRSTRDQYTGLSETATLTKHLYECTSSSGNFTVKVNGTQLFTTATNTPSINDSIYIGASKNNTSIQAYYTGKFAEFVIYRRVLTSTERTDLIGYINDRYVLGAT